MSAVARYRHLYRIYAVSRGTAPVERHVFREIGVGAGVLSLCTDVMWTVKAADNPDRPYCRECQLIAATEITLGLDQIGLTAEATFVAHEVSELSSNRRSLEELWEAPLAKSGD